MVYTVGWAKNIFIFIFDSLYPKKIAIRVPNSNAKKKKKKKALLIL